MIEGTDILSLHRTGTNPSIIGTTEKWNSEGRSFTNIQVGDLKIQANKTTEENGIFNPSVSSASVVLKPQELDISQKGDEGTTFSVSNSSYAISSKKTILPSISTISETELRIRNQAAEEDPVFAESKINLSGVSLESDTEDFSYHKSSGVTLNGPDSNFAITPSAFVWNGGDSKLNFSSGDESLSGYFLSYSVPNPIIEFDDTGVCDGHSLYFPSQYYHSLPILLHAKTINAVCNPIIVFSQEKTEKQIKIRFMSDFPIMIIKLQYQEPNGTLKAIVPGTDGWLESNMSVSAATLNVEFDFDQCYMILKKMKIEEQIAGFESTYSFLQDDSAFLRGCMNIDFKNKIINFFISC